MSGIDRSAGAHPLTLRAAGSDDARRLFDWANDSETRRASLSTEPILWDDHVAWLQRRLDDPHAMTLIAEIPSGPVGQVRFDRIDGVTARVSVVVAPEARGRGLATRLIAAGVDETYRTGFAQFVVAEIRASNERSLAAFRASGFVDCHSRAAGDGERVLVLAHHAVAFAPPL